MTKALDSDSDFAYAHWILGFVYEQKNMYDEAINHHQKAVEYSGEMTTCVSSLGHAYTISGKTNEANRVLNDLIELSKNQYTSSYDIAVIYAGLGEIDEAMKRLLNSVMDILVDGSM